MVTRRIDLKPTSKTDMRQHSSSFHELCAFMHPLSQDSAREQAWQIGGLRHAVPHLLSHFPHSGTSCLGLVSFEVVAAVVCWLSCCRPIDNSLSKAPMLGCLGAYDHCPYLVTSSMDHRIVQLLENGESLG